jgi:citrate lyase subunit beta/citryl-CoA lyase
VLYVPGSNARALAKARTLDADGLILDLEDAVAPSAKDTAREQVLAELAAGGFDDRVVAVRVNAPATPWGDADLAAAARSGADAIVLPKVERPGTVRAAAEQLSTDRPPSLWCMIETPLGVLRAAEIAAAGAPLSTLVMGTSDLVKDLRAQHTTLRHAVLTSLGLAVLAARAFGLRIVDGVHLDLDDMAGFEASCIQGRELGFDGKTLIHPKTIEIANRVFAPTADELEWSRRVIEAHAEALASGRGVVVVDGKLVENLHVENARRRVALAGAIARRQR